MTYDLKQQLRDLANCRHDDLSIGYEAADRIEQLETERDQLREQVTLLRKGFTEIMTNTCEKFPGQRMLQIESICQEALAATEPTAGGAS